MAARVETRKKERARGKRKQGGGLTFGFFVFVCVTLALTGGFIVYQNQLAVTSELKSRAIDGKLEVETLEQKSLGIELARLNSPARVVRIAQEELRMVEPGEAIYLTYRIDESGNIVPSSSYERWESLSLVREDTDSAERRGPGESSASLTSR